MKTFNEGKSLVAELNVCLLILDIVLHKNERGEK